nr:hypothetical protein [Tanacetum cinerariifolium]
MVNRLSKWKMKTLSIGGMLTLLKAVLGSMSIYHMSIFKVPMPILQRMESIRCHFFNGSDLNSKKSTWVSWNKVLASKRKVMQAIHGVDGRIGRDGKAGHASIWCDIIKEMDRLATQGIDLGSMMQIKIGNGSNTSFWEDRWRGEKSLKEEYPRLYALEVNKNISVASKFTQETFASSFRRLHRSGVEFEQWRDMLESLDGVLLSPMEDRWIKEVPIKVNIHDWKVSLDGLPTRWNISRRGMDISSILCPLCELAVETSKHLFF